MTRATRGGKTKKCEIRGHTRNSIFTEKDTGGLVWGWEKEEKYQAWTRKKGKSGNWPSSPVMNSERAAGYPRASGTYKKTKKGEGEKERLKGWGTRLNCSGEERIWEV